MKHSQNQVVEGLGLEFAPQDGRIAVIEDSVLATTRRIVGSNAYEQLKKHLRLVRQQRLEANEKNTTDKQVTLGQEDIRYYHNKAEELRAEVTAEFFSKLGKRIGHLFKTAKLKNKNSNVSTLLRDREIRRHIEHAEQLRAALMVDAIFVGFNSIFGVLAKVFRKVQQWHRQRVTWRELQSLSDYVLRDIGVTREQIKHFSKELVRLEETWVDQVKVNQEAISASEVVSVDQRLTPEHAANDGHRDLAA